MFAIEERGVHEVVGDGALIVAVAGKILVLSTMSAPTLEGISTDAV